MRLFASVNLTDEIQNECRRLQDNLERKVPGAVRWTKTEQLHLTMKFLGEVEEQNLENIKKAVMSVASDYRAFTIRLAKGGCFPERGRPRVVWISIDEGAPQLAALASLCEEAFVPLGFKKEERPFSPHITIGRVEKGGHPRGLEQEARLLNASPLVQGVERIALMKSTLSAKGAKHDVVEEFPLKALP